MTVVPDVSAIVEVLLNTSRAKPYRDILMEADTVIAPDLFISELANVAWKYRTIGNLDHDRVFELMENGIFLIDTFIPAEDLWKEALSVSLVNTHPVYDTMYAVCARRYNAILLTLDKRLKSICKNLGIRFQ
ncbi:MAG TPA: type II toxin-antitoxin system VapC family toxin [bacterium]|nr:type II toxin-antitoxin system VapC family toxin [bacterium]